MAINNGPGQRRALGSDIGSLGREELITLARAVCGQAAAFAGGHGNIHPENIFMSADGSPWLGERADHAPGEWTTDELEYMAPELFWSGTLDARADVYSIGLLLYAGVTRGRLPFFACAAEGMSNAQRAAALRRRMNGEGVPIPTIAGEKLGEVLRRCLAFPPESRYADTIELSMALEPCVGEGDAAAMAMFGKPESELSEVERTMAGILASYSAEEMEQPAEDAALQPAEASREEEEAAEDNAAPAAGAPAEPQADDAAADTSGASELDEKEAAPNDEPAPRQDADNTAPKAPPEQPDVQTEEAAAAQPSDNSGEEDVTAESGVTTDGCRPRENDSDDAETHQEDDSLRPAPRAASFEEEEMAGGNVRAGNAEPKSRTVLWLVIAICGAVAAAAVLMNILLPRAYPSEPVVIPTPTMTAEPAATPAPTPEATPSATPVATPSPTPSATPEPVAGNFEVVRSDISWTEAEQQARQMGGHLAVIRSRADFDRITALADIQGLEFVWVGLFRVNGVLQWVDPEAEGWYNWADGEPSVTDADGTAENFVLLWRTDSGWVYNDSRNDPAGLYPAIYSGNMGFVCEYD